LQLLNSETLAGMSGPKCKRIVVKPERRGGFMPAPVTTKALKDAKQRSIPIDERIHAP
jgi:hypothetical protein